MKPKSDHTIHWIPLTHLHPHPDNPNAMSPTLLKKLQLHIQTTHRYEPLLVRPHPTLPRHYQLINGHHRKRALQNLHHPRAACLVWSLSDSETLTLLATINRLSGRDAPAKRLHLLQSLSTQIPLPTLAALLPEDHTTLQKILHQTPLPAPPKIPLDQMPEAFTVFLSSQQKHQLESALEKTHQDPAQALMQWAEHFANQIIKSP